MIPTLGSAIILWLTSILKTRSPGCNMLMNLGVYSCITYVELMAGAGKDQVLPKIRIDLRQIIKRLQRSRPVPDVSVAPL